MTLRILCLDIEGGHGGSSRSLLSSLGALPRQAAVVEVVCRRGGWIESAYADIGIHCSIDPTMPTFTTLDRGSRNFFDGSQFLLRRFPQSAAFCRRLLEKLEDVLLKPTRGDNPWGRDILEAMANELPVASVGRYKRFVETGQTGLLQDTFDAQEVADGLQNYMTIETI